MRLSFFIILQPWNEDVIENKIMIGDSIGYQARAENIINSRGISSLDPWWTPGYVFFLTIIYFIFGVKPWIALLAQIILDAGTAILVYFMAREIFKSEIVPLIAAFLYCLSFPSAFYSIRLLSEIPFTFVLALAALAFIRSLKKNRMSGFALTGFFIGIAAYIRAVAIYFPVVFIFVLLFSNESFRLRMRNILVLLIIFAITLAPWQFRNLKRYGEYAMTTKAGVNLIVNASIVKADAENMSRQKAIEDLGEPSSKNPLNPFEKSKLRKDAALSYISGHPFVFIKCQLRGILKMFLGTGQSGLTYLFGIKTEPSYATEGICNTISKAADNMRRNMPNLILFSKQIMEYLFLIIGLAAMRAKDKRIFLLLMLMIILYFAAVTGPIGYSRFRVPIIPFYLVVSAEGIFETFRYIRQFAGANYRITPANSRKSL